jgi:hypothetical protein
MGVVADSDDVFVDVEHLGEAGAKDTAEGETLEKSTGGDLALVAVGEEKDVGCEEYMDGEGAEEKGAEEEGKDE